ncbi:MAG: SNF2-related protein [Streptosporangiaceae bacterium]
MGLGKTIQLLSLIAAQPAGSAPTLLVCPMSLVGNWCPPFTGPRRLYGPRQQRRFASLGRQRGVWHASDSRDLGVRRAPGLGGRLRVARAGAAPQRAPVAGTAPAPLRRLAGCDRGRAGRSRHGSGRPGPQGGR